MNMMFPTRGFLLLLFPLLCLLSTPHSLAFQCNQRRTWRWDPLHSSSKDDPFRTGNRPSLHPITINALSETLRKRALDDPDFSSTVPPLELAISSSHVAASYIAKRQSTSEADGMPLSQEEQQTIVGRVVGVVMRYATLEERLEKVCQEATWIDKYKEWSRFGLTESTLDESAKKQSILDDPLLRVNRAECLLALFIHEVETPELAVKNTTVPDKGWVDFLEDDRREVLLQKQIP